MNASAFGNLLLRKIEVRQFTNTLAQCAPNRVHGAESWPERQSVNIEALLYSGCSSAGMQVATAGVVMSVRCDRGDKNIRSGEVEQV